MSTFLYSYLRDVYGKHVSIKNVETEEGAIHQVDIILKLNYGITTKYRMSLKMYKDSEVRYDLQKHIVDKLNRQVLDLLLGE